MQKESSTAIYTHAINGMRRPLSRQQLLFRYQEEPLMMIMRGNHSLNHQFPQSSENLDQPMKRVKSTSHITPFYLTESFSFNQISSASALTDSTSTTSLENLFLTVPTTTPVISTNANHLPMQHQSVATSHTTPSVLNSSLKNATLESPKASLFDSNKIMDMSSEPTLETVYSRIRYNKAQRRLVLNFEGLHVSNREHIRNVRDGIEGAIIAHHPNETIKVQCVVNYDNYIVDDHLMEEYTEVVVVYLQKYYESIERFTTNNFLQEQVKKLEAALTKYRKSSIISPKVNIGKKIVGSRYVIQDLLGVGTYGRVSLAHDRESGDLVAIKELSKHKVNSIGIMDWVRREIKIMKLLGRYPRICTLYDVVENEDTIYLIMEYIEKGAIETPYDEHQQFPEEEAQKYFRQMVEALDYMHNVHHVCHRDFQLSNVCLDKNNNVKVCDFGVADFFSYTEKNHQLFVGNSNYCSPEMLMKKPYYGPEIDVYMLGVCLYKMCTGFLPFRNAQAKLMGTMTVPLEEELLSDDCKDIIQKLLEADPEKRMTIKQAMEHPFFTNIHQN